MCPSSETVSRIPIQRHYIFQAAHCLPLTPVGHKCQRMHGHTYTLTVEVEGPVQTEGPEAGMVVDFGIVDAAWKDLEPILDHQTLNETFHTNPTVENMTPLIWSHFATHLGAAADARGVAWAVRVSLSEGPHSGCRYPPST
jgi:6-pyruvoyltetrahydropterin/6-carboxytetrahydropterin synthase